MTDPVERRLHTVTGRRGRTRLPRLGEVVADSMRDAILRGELTVVPRLEDLIEQFEVGPPAVREALRILETEGLITVRRGNVGGADVHLPDAGRVAYMASLVLQSQTVPLGDVGIALRELEPMCAAMCAARPDREREVVPELERLVAEQTDAIGDVARTLDIVDRFHDAIVQRCGNATLVLLVGALERVWAGHASAVYERDEVEQPSPRVWKAAVREHERIAAAIARGDAGVAKLVRRHLEATHAYMSSVDDNRMVNASTTVGRA